MSETRNFKTEYKAFLQKNPYQTAEINGIKVRYQFGGKEGAPVLLFFNGLEMQEMWMAYAQHFGRDYRFLIYEYPRHTTVPDGQIDFAFALTKKLGIDRVILIGASDGGIYAQIFAKRYPEAVQGMLLQTTLTLDSDYVRNLEKEKKTFPVMMAIMRLIPAKTELKALLKKSQNFLACESPEDQAYGRTFYETVAEDIGYKQRFIHSYECVYRLKDYKIFEKKDFEYLRGKIQIIVPESDIFEKADQDRLVAFFQDLDAEILYVPGGHVGFIVQSEDYIKKLEKFLESHIK